MVILENINAFNFLSCNMLGLFVILFFFLQSLDIFHTLA